MIKPRQKLKWEPIEIKILTDIMTQYVNRGMSVNAASKVVSEALYQEGFRRTPGTCAVRWNNIKKQMENAVPAEEIKEEKTFSIEELFEILPDPEPVKEFTLYDALNFVRNYIEMTEEKNAELRAQVEAQAEEIKGLSEIAQKYQALKDLLTIH